MPVSAGYKTRNFIIDEMQKFFKIKIRELINFKSSELIKLKQYAENLKARIDERFRIILKELEGSLSE
jgi:hypothetical protein